MFIDKVDIEIKAGNGGDGTVAWRREKFEPSGGPAGGDGGDGGSVYIMADENIHTLLDFRYKRNYKAERGEDGMGKKMFGKKGQDITLHVPVGTLVKDKESQGVIVDLREKGMTYCIAKGGRGGFGNARFATSTRQAPGFAKAGTRGEECSISLELKLIADVGLIGFPNVGKSTILSQISAAKPKIANYHFTTLKPNLGVVKIGEGQSFVVADIPGLIEGASDGLGLGHEFLRHIERTRLLVHVIDMSGNEGRNPMEDYKLIRKELTEYNSLLSTREEIIFANKMDLPDAEDNLKEFINNFGEDKIILSGSAATTAGIEQLKFDIWNKLVMLPEELESFDEPFIPTADEPEIIVHKENNIFFVNGKYPDLLLRSTYFDDVDSIRHFQKMLHEKGIVEELVKLGIQEGDTVNFCDFEFEFGHMEG
ncbi:MAG: GTPase ObgE [Tissierellia bacterium]|nr:GTPase ObgE [Tissierellia bacterium]